MLAMMRLIWISAALAAAACGGGQQMAEAPDPVLEGDSGAEGDVLIPPEKFDEINRTFERKRNHVSRCFVVGVDAGEVFHRPVPADDLAVAAQGNHAHGQLQQGLAMEAWIKTNAVIAALGIRSRILRWLPKGQRAILGILGDMPGGVTDHTGNPVARRWRTIFVVLGHRAGEHPYRIVTGRTPCSFLDATFLDQQGHDLAVKGVIG